MRLRRSPLERMERALAKILERDKHLQPIAGRVEVIGWSAERAAGSGARIYLELQVHEPER